MRITKTVLGIAAGLGAMYFLDPRMGRTRRAKVRDKFVSLTRRAEEGVERQARGVRTRAEGIAGKVSAGRETPPPNDETLADKIRSEVLRNEAYPGIIVNCEDGVAVLRGSLDDQDAIDTLEQEVRKVTGVLDVRNLVHLPGAAPPAP